MSVLKLIEEFQCPGCVCGSDTKCGKYKSGAEGRRCDSHVVGTMILGAGGIVLSMPKGFNKVGYQFNRSTGEVETKNRANLYFYAADEHDKAAATWDRLNVPVWAMEKDGHLFVRVYMPRVDFGMTQVIEGGTLELVRSCGFRPLDVSEFQDEID